MRSICPRCGLPSQEGLCNRCLLESTPFLSCPSQVEVTLCPVCGAQHLRGRWQLPDRSKEELLEDAVRESVRVHVDLVQPEMTVDMSPRGATRYLAEVRLRGRFRDLEAEESCQTLVKLNRQTCDRCSRIAGCYFEGVVQIRGSGRTPDDKEISEAGDIALAAADVSYAHGDRLAFIQEIKSTKGGIDIVVGSTQLGRLIAGSVVRRFGGRTLESRKLVGRKDGKDIFRTTFLVRLPRFRQGDIIKSMGEVLEVVGHEARNLILVSLEDGSRKVLQYEDAKEGEILGNRAEARETVVIAVDENAVEILDPESYETAFASKPRHLEVVAGDEVKVVRVGEGFILLN